MKFIVKLKTLFVKGTVKGIRFQSHEQNSQLGRMQPSYF